MTLIDPDNFLHSLARFMAAAAGGLPYADLASGTTHYLSTAENSGSLQSILPDDLRQQGFRDDGMAQNGSINRARQPEGQYCRPPDTAAWQALADVAFAGGMPLTVEAEGLLRYAYDLWLSNNIECRAVMADLATGLNIWKARRPSVPLWIEHQGQLAQSLSIPRPEYAAFMAHEASLFGALIEGCTVMGYFTSLDLAAWDAERDFYIETMAAYYPGKRIKLIASSYLLSGPGTAYVGDAAMQHVVDYANARDCDILWWSASSTAPMQPQAWAFLRGLGVVNAAAVSPSRPRAMWRHRAREQDGSLPADPHTVLRIYPGPAQGYNPLQRCSVQCETIGSSPAAALVRAHRIYRTLLASDGTPLQMKTIAARKAADDSADVPATHTLVGVDLLQRPGLIGVDEKGRSRAVFNFDVGVFQI